MENLRYGNESADDAAVIAAAKAAYAHSFIRRLPQGYDTVISEGGGNLSQGQKQLLCIARAMLTDPEILILDEATSSIDTLTEIRVQKAFAKMMQGRTSFVVAHRLSTIKESRGAGQPPRAAAQKGLLLHPLSRTVCRTDGLTLGQPYV